MGVASVSEIPGGRSHEEDDQGRRVCRRTLEVRTDSLETREAAILRHPSVPRLWTQYVTPSEVDLGLRLRSRRVTETEDYCRWLVELEYSSDTAPESDPNDPLSVPTRIRYGTARVAVALEKDRDDAPILNSAGDPFDPPPETEELHDTLTIVRNEVGYDPIAKAGYKNRLNEHAFFGFAAEEVRCMDVTGEDLEGHPGYYRVTYEFERREGGWRFRPLSLGFRAYDAPADAGGTKRLVVDANGRPVTEPVLLASNGLELGPLASPHFMTYDVYRVADFGALNLP